MESFKPDSAPYRKMPVKTRPPLFREVVWKKLESSSFEVELGERGKEVFQVRVLNRQLVESASSLWRTAYPELYGSIHGFLLDPSLYEIFVALEETWEEDSVSKPVCMPVVVRLSTSEVIAGSVLTKIPRNLQVEYSFVATHPDYRTKGITKPLRQVTRQIALSSGAEYFTTFCETWHDITQNWCIKGGWKIGGIFPGNFLRWNGDGQYRGCVVWFYRLSKEAQEVSTSPQSWSLAEEVREVWECLERVNRRIEERSRR